MARIRTIKPEFWDDEKIASLERDIRLTYIGLWNFADDKGVIKGSPLWIKSKVYPYDTIQIQLFTKWLEVLERNGFISLFSYNKEKFYYLPKFSRHQVINNPSKTFNVPDEIITKVIDDLFNGTLLEDYGRITVVIPPGVGEGKEGEKEKEGERDTPEKSDEDLLKEREAIALEAKKKATHTRGAAKKPETPDLLFKESEFADKDKFKHSFIGTDYEHANLDYYHEVIQNWSNSKQAKKKDWLAASKNWMLSDFKDGKLVTQNSFNNGQSRNKQGSSNQKNTSGIDLDAVAAIMRS